MVVLLQSSRIASGSERATSSAVATQLAAAHASGSARALFDPDQRAGRGHDAQRSSRQRRGDRVEDRQHPDALALEHVDELSGRRQRYRVQSLQLEPPDDRRDRVGQTIGKRQTSNGSETVRTRPSPSTAAAFVLAPPTSSPITSGAGTAIQRERILAMRIVPVLDLKGGVVVHALRGNRADYVPLRSPLVDGSEPVAVARALCAYTGSDSVYVADLDAIAGAPADVETLRRLAARRRAVGRRGSNRPRRRWQRYVSAGAARNVIGTESLSDAGYARQRRRRAPSGEAPRPSRPRRPPPVLSVDLRDGRFAGLAADGPRRQRPGGGRRARARARRSRAARDRPGAGRQPRRPTARGRRHPGGGITRGRRLRRGGVRDDLRSGRVGPPPAPPARWWRPRCTTARSPS